MKKLPTPDNRPIPKKVAQSSMSPNRGNYTLKNRRVANAGKCPIPESCQSLRTHILGDQKADFTKYRAEVILSAQQYWVVSKNGQGKKIKAKITVK